MREESKGGKTMGTLAEIIATVKEIPESYLNETLEKVKEIKGKADEEESENKSRCPIVNPDKQCEMGVVGESKRINARNAGSVLCQQANLRFKIRTVAQPCGNRLSATQ
jgi:hypothetical protein